MGLRDKLNDTEKLRYDELYQQSRQLYPDHPDIFLETTIYYYIKNDEDDECFSKLLHEANERKLKEKLNEFQEERQKKI